MRALRILRQQLAGSFQREARFADAAGSQQGQQSAGRVSEQAANLEQFHRPPDKTGRLARKVRAQAPGCGARWQCGGRGAGVRRGRGNLRGELSLAYLFVKLRGSWFRPGAQLFFKQALAFLVGFECLRAPAAGGVQQHELAVSLFIERIHSQPAPHHFNGFFKAFFRGVSLAESAKSLRRLEAQHFALLQLPLLKGRAIPQAEACHKVPLVERRGGFQRREVASLCGFAAKILRIQPDFTTLPEFHQFAACFQPALAEHLVDFP